MSLCHLNKLLNSNSMSVEPQNPLKFKACTSNLQDWEQITHFVLVSNQINFRSFTKFLHCRKDGHMSCYPADCLHQIFKQYRITRLNGLFSHSTFTMPCKKRITQHIHCTLETKTIQELAKKVCCFFCPPFP